MHLTPILKEHYPDVLHIIQDNEPYGLPIEPDALAGAIERGSLNGFVVQNREGNIAGAVMFSHYVPNISTLIHVVIDRPYQKRWLNRAVLGTMFEYSFSIAPKVKGINICGLTSTSNLLIATGFKLEGVARREWLKDGQYYDVEVFGMFEAECRWIGEKQHGN
jgi:RimJ/RimL family protein N-acetyltransferase